MNVNVDIKSRIIVDDLSLGLYELHLEKKNLRINKVLKILILRNDFQDLLIRLENEGLETELVKNFLEKERPFCKFSREGMTIVDDYLARLKEERFFEQQTASWKENFFSIAESVITYTYLDAYANKNNSGFLAGSVYYDNAINSPGISKMSFDKELFWKVYKDSFLDEPEKIIQKYGRHPLYALPSAPGSRKLTKEEMKELSRPKVCQIVFDEETSKDELISYIRNSWSEIEFSLGRLGKTPSVTRTSASASFLRDIEIYNKYQEFKNGQYKYPDKMTYRWLKEEKGQELEIPSIRKIVSELRIEKNLINGGK